MINKKCLFHLNDEELLNFIIENGEKRFRIDQIFLGLLNGKDFNDIHNIPKELKELLNENFYAFPLIIKEIKSSKIDNSCKFIFQSRDNNIIESVYISNNYGNTLCVSTQVGCRMGCVFCASGKNGLKRNLDFSEIFSQYLLINAYFKGSLKERKISNIVLMGSGEPLDNFENVIKALKFLNEKFNISYRNISISTCGIVEKIKKLADLELGITLSISLHASNDKDRKELMNVAHSYSINQIIEAAKYYFLKTKRRIIIEYITIKNKNIFLENAKQLKILLRGLPCHINLINLNDNNLNLKPCSYFELKKFEEMLKHENMSCSIRRSVGKDIKGACGQLLSGL